ncbi:MAG: hypothetical protein PF513_04170 [Tenericutes bacterium]|nr:hypothetical protein [Mycoplasmatota bacterium]
MSTEDVVVIELVEDIVVLGSIDIVVIRELVSFEQAITKTNKEKHNIMILSLLHILFIDNLEQYFIF